jgi:hypothetical protein
MLCPMKLDWFARYKSRVQIYESTVILDLVVAVNMMSSFLRRNTHSKKMAVELGMKTCRIFLALHKIKELSGKN